MQFFPCGSLLSLQTAQTWGRCRNKWFFLYPHCCRSCIRAACTASTCIVCPICSHLVLLKVLISQPGLIYVQEQQHSHWRSRAQWLTLPLLKGEVGSHQGWVLGCPLLETSGEGETISSPLAHSGRVWASNVKPLCIFSASCLGLRECCLPHWNLGKRYWRVFLCYKKT